MNKGVKAQRSAPVERRVYVCANCPGEITAADNAGGGLISVNVDGHAKAAHRVCPKPATAPVGSADEKLTEPTTPIGGER